MARIDDAGRQEGSADHARARAEAASKSVRMAAQRKMLKRWKFNGSFVARKDIQKAGQVVIPKEAIKRWTQAPTAGVAVVLLDLEWGVLVLPETEATELIVDLGIDQDLLRRRGTRSADP